MRQPRLNNNTNCYECTIPKNSAHSSSKATYCILTICATIPLSCQQSMALFLIVILHGGGATIQQMRGRRNANINDARGGVKGGEVGV
jgi:hypothetical protein